MRVVADRQEGFASLPARAKGLFVDAVILGVIAFPLSAVLGFGWPPRWFILAASAIYFVPQIAVRGMTPGARFANVAITSGFGEPPGWRRSLIRWAVPVAIGLQSFVLPSAASQLITYLVVYGPALVDGERRGLHDRLAGAVAVEVRAESGKRRDSAPTKRTARTNRRPTKRRRSR
jgi:uncharacterized RDD family membrane protein YckC